MNILTKLQISPGVNLIKLLYVQFTSVALPLFESLRTIATLNTHNWANIKINIYQINIAHRQPQTYIQKIDVILKFEYTVRSIRLNTKMFNALFGSLNILGPDSSKDG